MKRNMMLLALLVLLALALPLTAGAESRGSCGKNVTWTLDDSGLLTISGTGAMDDYSDKTPWYNKSKTIKTIQIENGVTSIGGGAFVGCTNLTGMTIPDSVTSIGDGAFYGCISLTVVTIPDSVTSIGDGAFYGCISLTVVTIPDSVTSIGKQAFDYCFSLTDVYYTGSSDQWAKISIKSGNDLLKVARIHYNYDETAFAVGSCGKNVIWKLDNSGLLTISGTGAMDDYHWSDTRWNGNGEAIKTVQVENGVTSIGFYAFSGCRSLTGVTIPESVKSIKGEAFSGCSSLTSVTIPASVAEIGTYAFSGCTSLESIQVESGSAAYVSVDGVLFDKGRTTLIAYPTGKTGAYAIPDSVTSIGGGACSNCSSMTSVTIPDSVTSIGYYAFYGCSSLTDVYYTGSRKQWAKISINGANDPLTDALIHFKNSETELKVIASGSCGKNAAWSLDEWGLLTISGTGEMDDYQWEGAPWYSNSATIKEVQIENGVTRIGENALVQCSKLLSVSIPDSVTSIGMQAFRSCVRLKSVTIPESVTSIEYEAFSECTRLESIQVENGSTTYASVDGVLFDKDRTTLIAYPAGITGAYAIPDSVTSIGNYAFSSCSRLTGVTIPDSVTSIGDSAFYCCSNLTSMILPSSVTSIGGSAFGICYSLTSVTIPDSVTCIERGAFSLCYSLTTMTIPDSVTSIGRFAFSNCTSLTDVYYTGNSEQWDEIFIEEDNDSLINAKIHFIGEEPQVIASGACGENLTWTLTDSGLLTISGTGAMTDYDLGEAPWYDYIDSITKVVIKNGVTSIGNSAFVDCSNLTSVTIPDSVIRIRNGAFSSCSCLESIQVRSGNTTYASEDGVLFNKDQTTLIACPGGKTGDYAIPASVTSIGVGAFTDCRKLTSVYIPNGVTSIGDSAFQFCSSLTSVDIPDSVTSIGVRTFYCCSRLTDVTIPDSVTSIGNDAFYGCDGLTDVYYTGNSKQWAKVSIAGANEPLTNAFIYYNNGETELKLIASGSCGKNVTWTLDAVSGLLSISGTGAMDDYDEVDSPWNRKKGTITTVQIENGVTSIGVDAFSGCQNLTGVTIPSSVTSIGVFAFANCSSLKGVTIPSSVTSIGDWAFSSCSSLESIQVESGNATYASEDGVLFDKDRTTLLTCPGGKTGAYAIPSGVTTIGAVAFEDCYRLTSVTIPDSVTNIEDWAFCWCSGLTGVTIPSSVTSIGRAAFSNCSSLENIQVESGSKKYASVDGVLFDKDRTTLLTCPGGKTGAYAIPDSVTSIGDYAFYGCSSLTGVTTPDSVTSIGILAFNRCFELTSVTIPSSVTTIWADTFSDCESLTDVYYTGSSEQWAKVSIEEGNESLKNAEIHYD